MPQVIQACVYATFLCWSGTVAARSLVDLNASERYEQAEQQQSQDLLLVEGEQQHAVTTLGLVWQIQDGLSDYQQLIRATHGAALINEGDFYSGRYEGSYVYADATQLHRVTAGIDRSHDESALGRVGLRQQLDEFGLTKTQRADLLLVKAETYSRMNVGERSAVSLYLLAKSYDRQQITKTYVASLAWEFQPLELWKLQLTAAGSRQLADQSSSASYGPDLMIVRIFGVGAEVGGGAGYRLVDDAHGQTNATSGRVYVQKRDEAFLVKFLADRSLSTSTTGITNFQTDMFQLTGERSLARSQRLALLVTQKLESQLADELDANDIETFTARLAYTFGFGGAAATIEEQYRHELNFSAQSEELAVQGTGKGTRTDVTAGYTGHF